ncbi:MAG: metallophosphoesterase [Lentisphaerae bacterium]|mgnify:CR=1 FL=1|jgi:hypothetical protein|nr:metallophosphoesterase [Lentisphaerota bacterium]MBT4816124.1 metallophosphoesterase [Lentisphaerota bacterium]MBT5608400.1 metallophosphoesterase [Lentisphaerota bacterium]MBT7054980.1 metallophosphoesterase [Lentisphaerota bacterium]MBT7844823.1 metallophosphoesterase [Lentisphaerota bacterium]
MRIAFIGDTHYCIPREYGGPPVGPGDLLDHRRYTPMTDEVLRPLLDQVRQTKPDLVISSGDFVEGGLGGFPEEARREMNEGLAYFTQLGIPFLIARGTHDAPQLFAELVVPAMSQSTGGEAGHTYLRHDLGNCTFLILDYQCYAIGNPQDRWFEAQLSAATDAGRRIFVVAHAPVYLWGRHFFGEPALMRRLDLLLSTYSVDAYLCGHTHNQAVSFHARQTEHGWLQLMGSSVGYPKMPPVGLDAVHSLADFGPSNTLLWGILEDSAPGLFVIDVNPDGMEICWQSVSGEKRRFAVEATRTIPDAPETTHNGTRLPISDDDFCQIKSAVLGVFSYGQGGDTTQIALNGISLGPAPTNGSYAARRFMPLPSLALCTIGRSNTVTASTTEPAEYAIGSFCLEVTLLDGRILRSLVAPEILVSGSRWNEFPGARTLVPCAPGRAHDVTLNFVG